MPLNLETLFEPSIPILRLRNGARSEVVHREFSCRLDDLEHCCSCLFVRAGPSAEQRFRLGGAYRVVRCAAGGWLAEGLLLGSPDYWIPVPPVLRRVSRAGHIVEQRTAEWSDLLLDAEGLRLDFPQARAGWVLDGVIWRLSDPVFRQELRTLAPVEAQSWFLLGSHTRYGAPSDLYRHLVYGRIYEDRFAWPHRRRICSENDAHALHLIFSGLQQATGKRIYGLFKAQLLLSVLSRQSEDGSFRHGEWSDAMESHYRLHVSGMHLMMDALSEQGDDPVLKSALTRAADFVATKVDRLESGIWFLHDELETDTLAMASAPFKWVASRALGKRESNMLVLNTQLDTTVALDRFGELTGDTQHTAEVASARRATLAVLSLRPAEHLYRLLFWTVGLTLLPTRQAERLPIWKRVIKRFGWRYVIPRLPDVKARLPRLVMPGGYVDRELTLRTWAHHYLSVNLMDLTRYRRRFPDSKLDAVIHDAAGFAHNSGIVQRWAELKYERYALGFWAEALYHLCLLYPDADRYRQWLAEAALLLEDSGQGLPPSLLGANAEAVAPAAQIPCPSAEDGSLRVINLGRRGRQELLVINHGDRPVRLEWMVPPADAVSWHLGTSMELASSPLEVPARGWAWGRPSADGHEAGEGF